MLLHSLLSNPKDAPLLADVSYLSGALLDVLQHETNANVIAVLNELLKTQDATATLHKWLPQLDGNQTEQLIRACSLFAQVFNIAEDAHHERRRLSHEQSGNNERQGSLRATVSALKPHLPAILLCIFPKFMPNIPTAIFWCRNTSAINY